MAREDTYKTFHSFEPLTIPEAFWDISPRIALVSPVPKPG